jgi:hypothetical protein
MSYPVMPALPLSMAKGLHKTPNFEWQRGYQERRWAWEPFSCGQSLLHLGV